MTPKSPGGIRSRRAGTKRGLCLAALSCLALAASACSSKLTFSDAQTSFRKFSKCSVIEDVPVRGVKLKEAWLQNVIEPGQGGFQKAAGTGNEHITTVAQGPDGRSQRSEISSLRVGPGQSPEQSSGPQDAADEAYVMVGVIRAAIGDGPQRDDFTVLLVRKALDKYKVVNWATNVGREQEERKRLPALLEELRSKPYRGRCSW